MNDHLIQSIQELETYAGDVLAEIASLPREDAVVLALTGELGAGKTAFVKALAKHLGVDEHVTSPTFVIMKTYDLSVEGRKDTRTQFGFKTLTHIDAYRLENVRELEVLGWKELLADSDALIAIEWPEKVPGAMPDSARRFVFEHVDENTRKISFK